MDSGLDPTAALGLLATEDLLKELESRVDCLVIAYEFRENDKAHGRFRYHGGFSAAIGLVARFQHRLLWQDREEGDEGSEF